MKCVFSVPVAVLLTVFSIDSVAAQSALTALTNADVIRLAAIRVSDQTVIAVINEAKVRQFDLSAFAGSDLTINGVSTAVIAAMRQSPTPASTAVVPTARPQTIAEAAAEAAKIAHSWPLSTSTGAPPAPPMTASEAADLDRSKFDKVYAAGVAMVASGYAASRTPLARQAMLTFKTEAFIAIDRATTKAEKSLAQKYVEAQWRYEVGLDPVVVPTIEKWRAAFDVASAALEAANQVYLGKKP